MTIPVGILEHEGDACSVSTPEDAVKLHTHFRQAGVASNYNSIDGGFDLTGQNVNGAVIDECDALTHHGFLGIEAEAVAKIVHRFDNIFKKLNKE